MTSVCLRPMEGLSHTAEVWTAGPFDGITISPQGNFAALLALHLDEPSYYTTLGKSSLSSIQDPWLSRDRYEITTRAIYSRTPNDRLLISDLGWTTDKAAEIYLRLRHFEEDWDAPGMDAYDGL